MTPPATEGREGGFATVVAVGLASLVLLSGAVGAAATSAALSRHAAEGAADLAALAAAKHALEGEAAACAAGRAVAERNGARVLSCALQGLDAVVEVERALPGRLARFGPARARAKAGRA